MSKVFTGQVIGSIVLYSIIASVTMLWITTVVLIPTLTTAVVWDLTGLVSTFFDVLITGLILFAVVHNGLDLITYAGMGVPKLPRTPKIKRFSLNQRIQHLWLFVSMIFLSVTGMALLFSENWGQYVISDFGGFQATLDLHYASAIAMGALIVYHFGFYASKFVTNKLTGQPAPFDINIGLPDIKDAISNMKFYLGIGPKPKFGKYNYMEKFDYWGIYWGMIILGVPGVIMWADGTNAFNGLAFVFHTKEALLAVLFLGIFHLYQAHFSPRKFPMNGTFLSGTMSEAEMKEDHPVELDKLKAQGKA